MAYTCKCCSWSSSAQYSTQLGLRQTAARMAQHFRSGNGSRGGKPAEKRPPESEKITRQQQRPINHRAGGHLCPDRVGTEPGAQRVKDTDHDGACGEKL